MKPLQIVFGRTVDARLGIAPSSLALLAIAVGAATITAFQVVGLSREITTLEASANRLSQRRLNSEGVRTTKAKEPDLSSDQIGAANRAIERLNLPWRDLLDQLELAETASVSLLAIEPDPQRNVVRLVAEASDADAMVDYVAGLSRQPGFETATIRKHQMDQQSPYHPLRFTVELVWRHVDERGRR